MKKDKEGLKEEVNAQNIILDKGYIYTEDILKLIDQLEEPEQEKVVVPQFVADWIETMKQQNFTLGEVAEHLYSGDIKWSLLREYERWARLNFTKFTRAWLDGYTVEKEKLYRVRLPITVWDEESSELQGHWYYLVYDNTSDETRLIQSLRAYEHYQAELSETLIKAIDERYWPFAEEVTE